MSWTGYKSSDIPALVYFLSTAIGMVWFCLLTGRSVIRDRAALKMVVEANRLLFGPGSREVVSIALRRYNQSVGLFVFCLLLTALCVFAAVFVMLFPESARNAQYFNY